MGLDVDRTADYTLKKYGGSGVAGYPLILTINNKKLIRKIAKQKLFLIIFISCS